MATLALIVARTGHDNPAPGTQRPVPSTAPAPVCPAKVASSLSTYWTPAAPKGVDAAARFVPLGTPVHAMVCAYLHDDHGRLTGTRTLGGDLSAIPAGLAWLPPVTDNRPCPAYLAFTDGDAYLMALSYPDGLMWLSIPGNHCLGASNGRFDVGNLRTPADTAYKTGVWNLARPKSVAGCQGTAGRLGQQDRLVPDGAVSVQICQQGRRPVSANPTDLARLVSALNRLPTTRLGYTLTCDSGVPTAVYTLNFGYHVGPPIRVTIQQGCRPAIDNGSLQADDASSVLPLIHG